MNLNPIDIDSRQLKDIEMKAWIFILLVMASASSVVNSHMPAPNAARPMAAQTIGLD